MASPIVYRNRLLIGQIESNEGVDAVPTEPLNAILADTLEVTVLQTKTVDRKPVQPFLGGGAKIVVSHDAMIKIKIAMAMGADDNGVPKVTQTPFYDVLMRICGFQRATTAVAVAGTARGGTLNSIQLASGASATDGTYEGLLMSATIATGIAQAPGSTEKNLIKLAASTKEHGGTLQSGSTTTVLNFSTSASDEDGFYVGMTVVVGSEAQVISEYNGTTKQATLVSALGSAPLLVAYTVRRINDYFKNNRIEVQHFAGTVVNSGQKLSTVNYVYLPVSVVGANAVGGLNIKITTGSNDPETRQITSYDAASQRAKLHKPLVAAPTGSSTFSVSESAIINSYDGATQIALLNRNLRFATSATTAYSISDFHSIIGYNGTTKVALVTPPFKRAPNDAVDYALNRNITYSLLSANIPSATFYYYVGETLYAFTGARGDATFSGDGGNLLFADFTLTGILDRYENAVLPASTANYFAEPLPINFANTLAVGLHGYTDCVLKKFSIGLNNKISHIDVPGVNQVRLTDREVKGSITIEAVAPDTHDYLATILSGATAEFIFSHGPVGNNITLFSPIVSISSSSDSDSDGVMDAAMDITMPSKKPGNREIKIILQ